MIRLFTGHDPRESVGWHVFAQSVIDRTKSPVSITALQGDQRDGTNAFTYARFAVPQLCGHEGWAIYVDGSDMLLRGDLEELWNLRDDRYAVQVVKHAYSTKHARKYIGTEMEADNRDYPCKNWSSVVLWNCGHPENRRMTAEFVRFAGGELLHRFGWLHDSLVGELPAEWNWIVGEFPYNADAKLAHFSVGIPAFAHYRDCDYSGEWWAFESRLANGIQSRLQRTGT